MCSNILCIAAVLLGIDAGWRPLPDGGVEYLIQIEPHVLEALESGTPIQSDIPPQVKNVRAYRITVGTKQLPRELPAADEADLSEDTASTANKPPAPNVLRPDPARRPIAEQKAAYVAPAESTPESASDSHSNQPFQQEQQKQPPKPWAVLTVTLFGLFASLGGNAFLLWIAVDSRSRYRAAAKRANDSG